MGIYDVFKEQQGFMDRINPLALRKTIAEITTAERQFAGIGRSMLEINRAFSAFLPVERTYDKTYLQALAALDYAGDAVAFRPLYTDPVPSNGNLWERYFQLHSISDEIYRDEEVERNEPTVVVQQAKQVQRIAMEVYKDPKILTTIDPRAFEELIAELMHAQGFEVELTKQTRDGGYDIIALKSLDKHTPLKFLVECKRNAEHRPVGIEVVRSFKEVVMEQGANRGLLVAASYFSEDAKKKIQHTPYQLEYKDKDKVMEWIHAYYHSLRR